jgi:hypothetical protein
MRTSFLLRPLVAAIVLAAAPLHAQLIGFPAPPNSGNQFPFGSPVGGNPGTRYQQVYDGSQFINAPITGVRFFRTSATNGTGNVTDARYVFSLSTTTRAVNGLNIFNFNRNIGADNTQALDVTLQGVNVAFGSSLTFTFTNPFVYDPARGNLLLDIQLSNISKRGDVFFDSQFETFGDISSRAHNFGAGYDSTGLVTEFLHAPLTTAPEPSTYVLIGAGLAAIALVRRRIAV